MKIGLAIAIAWTLVSAGASVNRAVPSRHGSQPDITIPRRTPSLFASYNFGIAARVPTGLFYCGIPEDWTGSDHGRTFYLVAPKRCDATAGYVLSPVGEQLPRLDLYYGFNVLESEYRDGLRAARTAEELARQDCRHPHRLSGITLLGEPAFVCETERRGWLEISATTPYVLDQRADSGAPDAMLSVRLTTTRKRLGADRAIFASFIGSVHACAAQWHDDQGKHFWIGAAPGRPECPPNAFW